MQSAAHSVFELRYHLVLVTKYRRRALTDEMLSRLREHFEVLLRSWRCALIEFGGEADHVHLLLEAHPSLELARLVNNLKTASARKLSSAFGSELRRFYWRPGLWHRAYYIGSVGNASLETVRRYVEQQR